jgi:hypothetical protein
VVLNGSVSMHRRYDELLAARIITRLHPEKTVVLADCTWEAGSRALDKMLRTPRPVAVDAPGTHLRCATQLAIRGLRQSNLHCCVLSSHEKIIFPSSWGFNADHVHFTPYWSSNLDALSVQPAQAAAPLVFAGGDSMRDYRVLLEAAPQIDAPVVIATRLPLPSRLPANVTAGPLSSERYNEVAALASVAVVPLIAGSQRSGGQKTYLGAMALGQPVVVPEAPGVLDYVEPGRTGLVPPQGDARALVASINQLLHEPARARELGQAARSVARTQFSRERYASALYGLAIALAS